MIPVSKIQDVTSPSLKSDLTPGSSTPTPKIKSGIVWTSIASQNNDEPRTPIQKVGNLKDRVQNAKQVHILDYVWNKAQPSDQ